LYFFCINTKIVIDFFNTFTVKDTEEGKDTLDNDNIESENEDSATDVEESKSGPDTDNLEVEE